VAEPGEDGRRMLDAGAIGHRHRPVDARAGRLELPGLHRHAQPRQARPGVHGNAVKEPGQQRRRRVAQPRLDIGVMHAAGRPQRRVIVQPHGNGCSDRPAAPRLGVELRLALPPQLARVAVDPRELVEQPPVLEAELGQGHLPGIGEPKRARLRLAKLHQLCGPARGGRGLCRALPRRPAPVQGRRDLRLRPGLAGS
jgi:hypothetical protein